MYCITDQQIEYILNDIRRNGIDMEDLQLNLLDHICCIIEQQLKETDDFERFYHKTIKQFYKHELREIEEEAINLLTFKNFYAMKKAMLVSGTLSVAGFIVGSFFKIMHWPGASFLLIAAILTVSFIFLPLLFVLKTKELSNSRDKLILGLGTLAGMMYFVSMLFLLNHWNGSHYVWLTTLAITFFVVIPAYFFTGIRKPETRMNTIVSTILLVAATGMQFTLTALHKPQAQENNSQANNAQVKKTNSPTNW